MANPRQVHTHYDNLKVSRNAPPEVIKAAYRVLCQKYHPDKHDQNPEYNKIMSIINTSYHILMDPARRLEHDVWIAEQEKLNSHSEPIRPKPSPKQPKYHYTPSPPKTSILQKIRTAFSLILFLGFIGIFIYGYFSPKTPSKSSRTHAPPTYVRPLTAPNGFPWPTQASYLKGYPIKNNNGLSTIHISNERGSDDVYLKLTSLNGETIRHVFIPRGQSFNMRHIREGNYLLKFKSLNNGSIYKADKIIGIEEIPTYSGIRYTTIEYTLYSVRGGNTGKTPLSEAEF